MPDSHTSLYDIINGCKKLQGGQLIIPGYKNPSKAQKRLALMYMDWRDALGSKDGDNHYHDMCTNNDQTFGTFRKDSTCCGGNILGCGGPGGHGGNVVGVGGDCGGNCPRNYGSGDIEYTRCASAWGWGGSYGNGNSETVTGHWWGHGQSHMQIYNNALFVRDKDDIKDMI
jgi:hypothetical protein